MAWDIMTSDAGLNFKCAIGIWKCSALCFPHLWMEIRTVGKIYTPIFLFFQKKKKIVNVAFLS